MCTVSWIHTEEGYELFFNRDESVERGPEEPPRIDQREGIRFAGPVDSDFGGMWLSTNDCGISLGLLNGYGEAANGAPPAARSRGLLVRDLAHTASLSELRESLVRAELDRYAAFTVFGVSRSSEEDLTGSWVGEWTGRELREVSSSSSGLLVSSGFDASQVRARRHELLESMTEAEGEKSPEMLARFHSSHALGLGSESPCMHREEAETRSFTRIRLSEREIWMQHTPGSPCRTTPGASLTLPVVNRKQGATSHE